MVVLRRDDIVYNLPFIIWVVGAMMMVSAPCPHGALEARKMTR